jgi:hypothetical protein
MSGKSEQGCVGSDAVSARVELVDESRVSVDEDRLTVECPPLRDVTGFSCEVQPITNSPVPMNARTELRTSLEMIGLKVLTGPKARLVIGEHRLGIASTHPGTCRFRL